MDSKIMSKVFFWMFIGLAVTFVTGSIVANNPDMILEIFKGGNVLILGILEIGLAIWLSTRITKMSSMTAKIMFIIYSFVSGLTFSSIFIVYKISSIIYVFLATSIIMLLFALFGYFTKINLLKFSTFLLIGLLGILIMHIISIFVGSETFSLAICALSIGIFMIYIAFDIQNIKRLYQDNQMPEDNLAIYGALQLYLDFINIFFDLLRIFGKEN